MNIAHVFAKIIATLTYPFSIIHEKRRVAAQQRHRIDMLQSLQRQWTDLIHDESTACAMDPNRSEEKLARLYDERDAIIDKVLAAHR